MTCLHVSLLGRFACRPADGEPLAFPTRKVRALAAYLAANADRAHGREKLAGLLWGEQSEAEARGNLRKALSRLRQSLPAAARQCVAADLGQVRLRAELLEVDGRVFERLVAEGTPETLEQAALLYRGPFLDGFGDCGEAFETWLVTERRRFEELHQHALQRLLEHYAITGAIDRAIQAALRLLALDPLQESVHRALIRLYMHQDRLGAALEQYRRCRERLADELGVAPAPETERLHAELRRLLPDATAPAPETDDLPERATAPQSAARQRARRRAELAARPSIAVLPFAGADDGWRHLGDGLADDVATELGRFRELEVIAPAAVFAYRHARVPPQRAAAELGAAYVLEGRLRPAGERLRITVRLIETGSARQLWAERYDRARLDTFAVQDEVVRRIVGTVSGQIDEARLDAARRQPADLEAYDLCRRGWSALRRPDLAAIDEARRAFQQAIARDPHCARAYVGLAMAHLNEWACFSWNHWVFPKREVLDLARRAVELDDRDHRARCVLGLAQLYGRDYAGAQRQLLRALELNPNDADVLAHVAVAMALIGDHQLAVEAGRSALRLAPHHPEWYAAFAGIALFSARLHEEAIETMAPAPEALCNTPAFIAAAHAHLGNAEACAGHRETVYRHHRRQLARGTFPRDMSCIDWLLAMDPFQRPSDLEHYAEGLRKAGFA